MFNGTYLVIAVFFNVLWRYACAHNHHLLAAHADYSAVDRISNQYALGPLSYLICLALAWVSVPVSLGLNLLLAIFFALPPEFKNRQE